MTAIIYRPTGVISLMFCLSWVCCLVVNFLLLFVH